MERDRRLLVLHCNRKRAVHRSLGLVDRLRCDCDGRGAVEVEERLGGFVGSREGDHSCSSARQSIQGVYESKTPCLLAGGSVEKVYRSCAGLGISARRAATRGDHVSFMRKRDEHDALGSR